MGAGDEVIVPTWTFTSSAATAVYLGARPVLVDVERSSLNASVEAILAACTPRTRAIVAVHFAGLPLAIDDLVAAADARGISVIEDAAHAFPSRLDAPSGRLAGTVGRAGAFSFYATKTITTGEGGMLVTDDDSVAARVRTMSLHGIARDAWNRYGATGSWFYEVVDAGHKYNLTDIAAALGLVQLERADELLEERQRMAARYRSGLAASSIGDLVELPVDGPGHAWHLFVLRLHLDRLRIDRAAVIEGLRGAGIGASVHFIPLHRHPYYAKRFGLRDADFPVASTEYERVLSLPLWPGMGDAGIDRVVGALETVVGDARA